MGLKDLVRTYAAARERSTGAVRHYVRWRRVLLFALCFGLLVAAVGMMLALRAFYDNHSDPQEREYIITRCVALGGPVFFYGAIVALAAFAGLLVLRYSKSIGHSRK